MKILRSKPQQLTLGVSPKRSALSRLHAFDWVLIMIIYLLLAPVTGVYNLTDFMVFTIFVFGFDMLYGYMGRLSFGHMLYMGTGAYAATIFGVYVSPNPLLVILFGILGGALIGVILGPIIVKASGSAFALINLAFNQVGYFLVLTAFAKYTGGEDGLGAYFSNVGPLDFYDPRVRFAVTLVCLLIVFMFVKKLTASPYGLLLRSIKENETRVKFLGYNTFRYKWINFIISTSISALAGALWVLNFAYVTPSAIDPQRNVEIIFAALIGGPGSPYGALLGGGAYMAISNYLASYIPRWELFLGFALLILVFRAPKGIWGSFVSYLETQSEKRRLTEI